MGTVDTARARDRRSLRFQTVDELLKEIDRLIKSDTVGKLRKSGNWSLGQAFGHLAAWINYGYEGYPFKTPWLIRVILRTRVKKYLRDGMPAGVRIPKVENGTHATDALSTAEGADRLRKALNRLQNGEPAKFESPAFGPMLDDQRIAFNLRHAELHLSFFQP